MVRLSNRSAELRNDAAKPDEIGDGVQLLFPVCVAGMVGSLRVRQLQGLARVSGDEPTAAVATVSAAAAPGYPRHSFAAHQAAGEV